MSKRKGNPTRTHPASTVRTTDSFANFQARLGWGADNLSSASQYTLSYQSRNRIWLEAAYRGSWIVAKAVDAIPEDMTRAGIEMSGIDPTEIGQIERDFQRLKLWDALCDNGKWARLYGGSIAVMLVDGQDTSTPLRPETIARDQFKGLAVLDRWMVNPPVGEVVKEFGPDMGQPLHYDVMPGIHALSGKRIHYSRVLRMEGADLPYYQRVSENGWGLSVLEPMWDRLVAFDSATVGAGQLVYKAHLRTISIEGLREIVAQGGPALAGLKAMIEFMRAGQTNEGITAIDAEDKFEAHQYSFSGLSDMLIQFAQQLSGATGIPMVRLFGQSPAGLNATGEGDMKQYHENIKQQQERRLRNGLYRLLSVISMSTLRKPLPAEFQFEFRSLQETSEGEKADIAQKKTTAVIEAHDSGLIDRQTAMKELKASAPVTGLFGNITPEQIDAAEEEDPPPPDLTLPDLPTATKDSFLKRFLKR